MGTDIASGQSSPTPDPIQPSRPWPAVDAPTEIQPGQLSGPTYPARDLTGERLAQLADYERQIAGAQSADMDARNAMLGHYQAQAMPLGGHIGDAIPVPDINPPFNAYFPESNP